uniref:Uncharacterized protein MANES_05G001300 n=1 Tax=Rhizophora mucronata TaxID=61149 RepID=A0A2P2J6F0_RHIMU
MPNLIFVVRSGNKVKQERCSNRVQQTWRSGFSEKKIPGSQKRKRRWTWFLAADDPRVASSASSLPSCSCGSPPCYPPSSSSLPLRPPPPCTGFSGSLFFRSASTTWFPLVNVS